MKHDNRELRADMKYVLATDNPGKILEMREILSSLGIEITTRKELGVDVQIEETGSTFLENAMLKADAICRITGFPAIADDSGLIVDALDGAPGVYSSSYGGEELDDSGRCGYLLDNMRDIGQRSARFVCTIVCRFPDGRVISAEGECRGNIISAPRGCNGFGYDPVFLLEGSDMTMAELTSEQKNALSHRGKALRSFALLLK